MSMTSADWHDLDLDLVSQIFAIRSKRWPRLSPELINISSPNLVNVKNKLKTFKNRMVTFKQYHMISPQALEIDTFLAINLPTNLVMYVVKGLNISRCKFLKLNQRTEFSAHPEDILEIPRIVVFQEFRKFFCKDDVLSPRTSSFLHDFCFQ